MNNDFVDPATQAKADKYSAGVGDKVGDALDQVGSVVDKPKLSIWLRIGAIFARLGESLSGKRK